MLPIVHSRVQKAPTRPSARAAAPTSSSTETCRAPRYCQRRWRARLAFVTSVALTCLAWQSASASATDPGTLNIETRNVDKTTNRVTEITNREILHYVYNITGRAVVQDHTRGGQITEWHDDRDGIDDTDFATVHAEIRSGLESDAKSLPGTTTRFDVIDRKAGERFELIRTTQEDVPTGTETLHYTNVYVDPPAQEGVDYLTGDSDNPSDWLAINDVTVHVDNITETVNHIDHITTEFGNDVTAWQIEVLRVIGVATVAAVPTLGGWALLLLSAALALLALRRRDA